MTLWRDSPIHDKLKAAGVLDNTILPKPYKVTSLRIDCPFNIEERLIDLNIPWFEMNHEDGQGVDLVVDMEDIKTQLAIKQNNNGQLTGFALELANLLLKHEDEFSQITFYYQRGATL